LLLCPAITGEQGRAKKVLSHSAVRMDARRGKSKPSSKGSPKDRAEVLEGNNSHRYSTPSSQAFRAGVEKELREGQVDHGEERKKKDGPEAARKKAIITSFEISQDKHSKEGTK